MTKVLRQGDVCLVRLQELPSLAKLNGETELRIEGETAGHIHLACRVKVAVAERPRLDWNLLPPRQTLIVVDEPTIMTHPEHPPLEIPAGVYEVRQAREYGRSGGVD